MSSDIDSYITQSRNQGVSDEEITRRLTSVGWTKDQIEHSLGAHSSIPVPPPVHTENPHSDTYDSFLTALMFISMGIYVSSLAVMLHVFTDKWIPSTSGLSTYDSWNVNVVRYLTASIIVSFPFFAWLFYRVTKKRIESRQIITRSITAVFIYITLTITFIFLLINLISVVLAFIEGTSSINFFTHVLITSGISGLIFWYFSQLILKRKHEFTS